MFHARFAGLVVPVAENPQPPDEILAAIGPGRPVVRADRQVDALAGAQQLVGDLGARRSGADHQHRTIGQLAGIAVGVGMDLHDPGLRRHDGGDDRALKGSGGGDQVGGLDHARRRFRRESPARRLSLQPISPRRRSGSGIRSAGHRLRNTRRSCPWWRSCRDRCRRRSCWETCHARPDHWRPGSPIFPSASARRSDAVRRRGEARRACPDARSSPSRPDRRRRSASRPSQPTSRDPILIEQDSCTGNGGTQRPGRPPGRSQSDLAEVAPTWVCGASVLLVLRGAEEDFLGLVVHGRGADFIGQDLEAALDRGAGGDGFAPALHVRDSRRR